jgi:hypothetical protein
MALDRPAKSWRDWNEVNPWLFPSVLELAEDCGPIGELLRRLPEELRRDANRCPDPWRELRAMQFLQIGGYP